MIKWALFSSELQLQRATGSRCTDLKGRQVSLFTLKEPEGPSPGPTASRCYSSSCSRSQRDEIREFPLLGAPTRRSGLMMQGKLTRWVRNHLKLIISKTKQVLLTLKCLRCRNYDLNPETAAAVHLCSASVSLGICRLYGLVCCSCMKMETAKVAVRSQDKQGQFYGVNKSYWTAQWHFETKCLVVTDIMGTLWKQ